MSPDTTRVGSTDAILGRANGLFAGGTQVGRLVVLKQVGEGGMGRAYSAYDNVLDRRVCLKFLKTSGVVDASIGNQRLIAEARALAQISHPNILPLFDVGEFEDQVYLVTEFVDGWTISEWIAQEQPNTQQILSAYAAACAGLQAAHAAGIVHRDFKPDNVMIGRDQRIRVMDFGLAVSNDDEEATKGYGTPRYMAPEQFDGDSASSRSDQYAFCLSLVASLGGDLEQCRDHPEGLDALPLDTPLRAAVQRGLEPELEMRHPDLTAIVDALSANKRGRGWQLSAALGAGLALTIGYVGYQHWQQAPACNLVEQPSNVWQGANRQTLREGFAATALPYANSTMEHVLPVIDGYLSSWSEQRLDACEATHVEKVQSADLLDRRMICLDSQLAQLDSLGQLFAVADQSIVDGAMQSVLDLPDPSACADRAALLSRAALPTNPGDREQYAELDQTLAAAWADRHAGRYQSALDKLEAIRSDVADFPHLPTQGRFQQLLGDTIVEMEDKSAAESAFDEGLFRALAGGDIAVAVDSAMGGAFLHTSIDTDPALAARWYSRAELLAAQLDDPERQARLANEYGQFLLLRTDQAERALSKLEFALNEYTRIFGPQSPQTAMVMNEYAWALHRNGDLEAAIEFGGRSLAVIETSFGTHHNAYLAGANNYASLLTTAHRSDEALALLEKAYEAGADSVGAEHKDVLFLLLAWATALFEQSNFEQARPRFQTVMRDTESSLGAQHRLYGFAATGLGACQRELGQTEAAIASFQRALDAGEKSYPPILLASMSYELAQTLEQAGAPPAQILAQAERALRNGANAPIEWRADVQAFAERWRQ